MDIAELGIRVDSSGALKGASDLDRLTGSAKRAEGAADRLAVSSRRAGAGMALAGGGGRMLTQQLSQVAQQGMATGHWAQAFAIQAADIGLAFGGIGAAAGILATVALPMLTNALFGAGDGAKSVSDRLEEMDGAVGRYISAAQAARATTSELTDEYGRLAGAAGEALRAMADIALVEALKTVNASISQIVTDLTEMREFAGTGMLETSTNAMVLRDSFGMAAQDAARLRAALEGLNGASGLEAQAVAALEVQRALLAAYGSAEKMPAPLQNAYGAMAKIVAEAAKVNGELEKSSKIIWQMPSLLEKAQAAAVATANAVAAIGGAANAAYSNISSLVGKMWEMAQAKAAATAKSIDQFQAGGLAEQYKQYGQGRVAGETAAKEASKFYGGNGRAYPLPSSGGGGGGGGGGGATDDFQTRLEALQAELQTERETVDAWYADAQKILADRRAQELMGIEKHNAAKMAMEKLYAEQIAEIEMQANDKRLAGQSAFFGAIAGIMASGGQRMAKAAAAAGAIEGTINAYRAALQAMADPTVPFWGKAAAYLNVLGAGLKGVAAIRQAGGIGGSSAAPAAQAVSVAQPKQLTVIQGLKATDIFTGQMVVDLLHDMNRKNGGGLLKVLT